MFYYHPVVEHAYMDMKYLQFDVPFGQILRNIHRWGAHLMVMSVMLHMLRVFLTGSYKPPREFNWVVGVMLLTLTLLMSFTGYLLPWDQLAYWAVTVGTNMGAATPFIGAEGPFTIATKYNDVRRFYVAHVIAVPAIVFVGCAIHFWRIRKDGGISRPL
jgi:quinol-cytochrome oxidoreductase complex cytochrome b subunit